MTEEEIIRVCSEEGDKFLEKFEPTSPEVREHVAQFGKVLAEVVTAFRMKHHNCLTEAEFNLMEEMAFGRALAAFSKLNQLTNAGEVKDA